MDPILLAGLVLVLGIAVSIILGIPIAVGIGLSSFGALMVLLGFAIVTDLFGRFTGLLPAYGL